MFNISLSMGSKVNFYFHSWDYKAIRLKAGVGVSLIHAPWAYHEIKLSQGLRLNAKM